MVDVILYSPMEVAGIIAHAAKQKRLFLNLSQKNLAERSGVSLGALKKFEGTGQISLTSLLRIALVLDALNEFLPLFKAKAPEEYRSINELLKRKIRKRGRK